MKKSTPKKLVKVTKKVVKKTARKSVKKSSKPAAKSTPVVTSNLSTFQIVLWLSIIFSSIIIIINKL